MHTQMIHSTVRCIQRAQWGGHLKTPAFHLQGLTSLQVIVLDDFRKLTNKRKD